jgi:hypothetical protein
MASSSRSLDTRVPSAHTRHVTVSPLPRRGGVQFDPRGAGRALRVSAHPETNTVTISIWHGDRCVATHHVATADVPELINLLATALVPPTTAARVTAS